MGASQRRVRPALRTGVGSVPKRWRRPFRKVERIEGPFCLVKDGPDGAAGVSLIVGFGCSGRWTRNRGLGVGVARGFTILRVGADMSEGGDV
jgi:hypothetical protein